MGSIAVGADAADELAEILGLAEIAVDRGEAHIGHLIEAGERLHHEAADHLARYLAFARAFELTHHRVDDALDALSLDRALAQRHIDRARELVAVESLALAVFLDDGELAQLHALEGREACRAIGAEAPPADRGTVVGRSRILYLGVIETAERTAHLSPPRLLCRLREPVAPARGRNSMQGFFLGSPRTIIDRKTRAELVHLGADTALDPATIALRRRVQHLADHAGHGLELGDAEAASRRRRRAETDA